MIERIQDMMYAQSLFAGWEETCILSCLQGVMGSAYGNTESVVAALGDFCFYAGKPDEELLLFMPDECKHGFRILTPQNEAWCACIESIFGDRAVKKNRYAIKKERDIFNRAFLEKAALSAPDEYTFEMIDEALYHQCMQQDWSEDFVSNYACFPEFEHLGLGIVALDHGEIVAGASSYSSFVGGIEVEIGTREDYRRKGLAFACGARLILSCLDRNLYPSWDAANLASVSLAEKLGYHYSHTYPVYEL